MRPIKIPVSLFALAALWCFGAPRAAPSGKKLDLFVFSEKTLVPGSSAAVRVVAKTVRSMTESQPLAGARVSISLDGKGSQQQLFTGQTDRNGIAEATFRVPAWPLGSYQMAVGVQSRNADEKTTQTIELRRTGRILLVTDKPIYQPRQLINMRALLLSSHDLRPLAGETVRFEVQDPKGNKVFRNDVRANPYGVVSTTFQLADEILLGNYQIEATAPKKDLAEPAAKTVVVKKYVLPKFKVGVETDRSYYLPKQTLRATVRSDYFFGKPVGGGKVVAEASTFDGTSFQKFSTLKGQTRPDGTWSFDVTLPDYFVGQPLQKGDALVKLEVQVTDTANHSEKGIRSIPVSATPIRVTAMPEGGRIVPDLENQLYVVATYPDGSPARAIVVAKSGGRQVGSLQTDSSGVGAFLFTPRENQMRAGGYQQGVWRQGAWAQVRAIDLNFTVRDARGNSASIDKTFSTSADQDDVLLRTDKAIYKTGEVLEATVLAMGGGPDAMYLDVVKNRQTVLTRVVYLKKGRGQLRIPLGPDLFGSIELHAYRIEPNGEMSRDARVLYVQPPSELTVEVSPDKKIYRPSGKAVITFRVTDAQGHPQAAALGVVIVDEAVYALQEIQPGLEKVYFTLERELTKPRYEIEFAPADNLQQMIQAPQLDAQRQRVAKVLLAGARPATAAASLWRNPVAERNAQSQQNYYVFRSALYQAAYQPQLKLAVRGPNGRWAYVPGVLDRLRSKGYLTEANLKDPLGARYTIRSIEKLWPDLSAQSVVGSQELSRLWSLHHQVQYELNRRTSNLTRLGRHSLAAQIEAAFRATMRRSAESFKDPTGKTYTYAMVAGLPGFRPEDFADQVHQSRVQQIYSALSALAYRSTQAGGDKRVTLDEKRNAWVLPTGAIRRAVALGLLNRQSMRDVWGRPFVLRGRAQQRSYTYDQRLRFYEVISAGPDGRLASADDLVYPQPADQNLYQRMARSLGVVQPQVAGGWRGRIGNMFGRGGGGGGMRRMKAARLDFEDARAEGALAAPVATAGAVAQGQGKGAAASSSREQAGAPVKREVRVREYFPETLLFKPALITDGQGQAKLELAMADSITTWRMTASANSAGGLLGSTSQGLKVFQDFFVDLDLPVSLTQNDEVSVPVVVYNYLKQPQRVRLELKDDRWFELKGSRVMDLKLAPSEVAASYYRIKVKDLGRRTLEVRADGSQMSDAIRREIEVLPDGQEQNLVANGRLEGTVLKTVSIPGDAVPGASKILVRLYPGVFSQVIEGMQSMLRLPYG